MNILIPNFSKANAQNSLKEYKFTTKNYAGALKMARISGFSGEPQQVYTATTFTTVVFLGFMTDDEIKVAQKKIKNMNSNLSDRLVSFLQNLY